MAFKGDLRNISLFDVFQTLNQNKQTGVLVLQRETETKKIHISPDGVRIFFTRSFRPLRLGEIFVRRGLINPQDIEILLLEQKKDYRPIGQLLVDSGKVEQTEIDRVLRYHAEDEVFDIFSWQSGTFSFYDGQDVGDAATPLSEILMDPAGLCLEAARRLDEMERLRATIPSNGEFFIQSEDVEPDREQTLPIICSVYDALCEPLSVDDLRDLVGLSLYDTLNAVHALVQGGLVRPLTVEELVDTSFRARDAGDHARSAQLLELAHQRAPDNREILEFGAQALQRLQQPRRLARTLATLGSLSLQAGDLEEAVEYLEQSLRHDQSHAGALVALRDAFAEQGDVERAAEVSLKIGRAQAESGNLDGAIDACREGLEFAPGAISLRYYFAQLLIRADRVDDARGEIYTLIHETENSRKTRHSEKALDLLASCYRFLLKIDSDDEEAQLGLRELERRRSSFSRKRKFAIRGGIAAAVLALVGGVGLTFRGPSPDEMLSEIVAAHQSKNEYRTRELITELVEKHPDSPQASQAVAIRKEWDKKNAKTLEVQKALEAGIRKEMSSRLEDVRAAMSDKPYVEAIDTLIPFLDSLKKSDVAFLRKTMSGHIEYALLTFLERVLDKFKEDRKQVATAAFQLQQLTDAKERESAPLLKLESNLARVRRRSWQQVLPDLTAKLQNVAKSKCIGKAGKAIEEFRRELGGTRTAFNNLDELYYAVKRERMRAEIVTAVALAKREGRQHLRVCQFEKARKLYEDAYQKANEVIDQEPRRHFLRLLNWLEQRHIRANMKRERDKIDNVVATLAEIERRRKEGQADVAYRLLRDLVSEHRLIEFEHEYQMPYRVISTPKGASVYLDERLVGTTPCSIEMDIVKRASLRVKREGFHEEERRLLPTDETLDGTLRVSLNKKLGWSREIAGTIEAAPLIVDGRLLLATNRASLLALDLADGGVAWEAKTGLLDRVTAAPILAGENVFLLTAEGSLIVVRRSDGKKLGRPIKLPGKVHNDAVFDGETLFVVTSNLRLLAVRGNEIVNDVPLSEPPSTGLALWKKRLFVGTAKGVILVHDAVTGKKIGQMRAPSGSSFFGGLTIHGDLLLAGAEDGRLYAFDTMTLKRKWDYATSGPVTARAASDGAVIYLPARDGHVHTLRASGRHIISYDVGSAVEHVPALDDAFLYAVGGFRIQSFNVVDQTSWWGRTFKDEKPEHILAGGGYVVVITDKPWIYAFEKDVK